MPFLVTCDHEWDDQAVVTSIKEAKEWAEEHAIDTDDVHHTFRLWHEVDKIRSIKPAMPVRSTFLDSEDRVGG